MRLDKRCGSLQAGACRYLPGRRPVWGGFVHLSARRLEDGDVLFIASSGARQAEAINASADRWQVETRFGGLKRRGFHCEDTHLTDPQRLSKLMAMSALTVEIDFPGPTRHRGRPGASCLDATVPATDASLGNVRDIW